MSVRQIARLTMSQLKYRLEAEQVSKSKFLVVGSVLSLVAVMAIWPVISAKADDADLRAVNNRLDRIERSVNDMQRNYSSGGGDVGTSGSGSASDASVGGLQVRLNEVEEQLRNLTGRIEELGHKLDQNTQDLQSYKEANDLRFQELQSGGAAPGAAPATTGSKPSATFDAGNSATSPAQTAEAAPLVSLPAGTPQTQYDFAIDLLKRGQFPGARDAFKQFLQAHPKDALAGNAQYWLGETYYVQGQYKDAADSFLKGYTTYSKSNKAPDSLLKLGMTLAALNQKNAACATFGQLKEQFPQASPAIVARNKQERQKVGC